MEYFAREEVILFYSILLFKEDLHQFGDAGFMSLLPTVIRKYYTT